MISGEQWKEAIDHLNRLIKVYFDMGEIGKIRLDLALIPLRDRLNSGERTEDLYEDIMDCV